MQNAIVLSQWTVRISRSCQVESDGRSEIAVPAEAGNRLLAVRPVRGRLRRKAQTEIIGWAMKETRGLERSVERRQIGHRGRALLGSQRAVLTGHSPCDVGVLERPRKRRLRTETANLRCCCAQGSLKVSWFNRVWITCEERAPVCNSSEAFPPILPKVISAMK
ncbi:hypothetical protein VTK56DRAFT_6183 [Thermocarpiscus australiensis]